MRRADRALAAPLAFALAGCSPPAQRTEIDRTQPAASGPVYRVGPDGGPLLAERGIGGTSAPATAVREADRGIGGTGIIGVITGFASVCLAGREVALPPDVSVALEGWEAGMRALRAGQIAAIEAEGVGADLRARRVAVRYEVSGPVEAVDSGGAWRVAGQRVAVSDRTWGMDDPPRPGDWVSVSGLRRDPDTVEATRLDRRAPGRVLVHGVLEREGGGLRIGGLQLRFSDTPLPPGRSVTASGRLEGGVLVPDTLTEDVLAEDPPAYFGRSAREFVVEGYSAPRNGQIRLGRDLAAPAPAGAGGRAVVAFERRPDGSVRLNSFRELGPGGGGGPEASLRQGAGGLVGRPRESAPVPSRAFEPAPVPNRAFNGRVGWGFRGGEAGAPSRAGGEPGPGGARPGSGPRPRRPRGP